jgi:hypothetical protein
LILNSVCALAQTWSQLKAEIKSDYEKNQRSIQSARVRGPLSFSDGQNHFLMQAVHPSGKPIYLTTLNSNAGQTTGASLLQTGVTGFVLTGIGHSIYQWDAGAVLEHNELVGRILTNEGTVDRHATHVAGTLIASGINPQSKGMAPDAKLHAYYFNEDIFEMATQSEKNANGFMISNHSYGITTGWHRVGGGWQWWGDELISVNEDFTAGFYSVRSQRIDEIAHLSPYHTIVWAAGNDRADVGDGSHPPDCNGGTGYDCIIQEGAAKNIITVGGVDQVLNYIGPSNVTMSSFSSWGPTDDGRIKPDIVSDGVSLLSTNYAGVDQYVTTGGTSMATATVSGSLLLLQGLYGKLNGNRWMRASTVKALAIHTAKEAGNALGPDYSFGWGLIDVAEAARIISKRDDANTFVIEGELMNDAVHEWVLNPLPNQKMTATLVWADPAGLSPGAILDPPYKMLINDLDLKLLDNNGVAQLPWILDPQNPSTAAIHGDNTRDNVEKIEFTPTETKPYKLRLGHKGYLLNDAQHYSLIITYTSTNASKILYWIGGSGNWNDPVHWSLNSGGISAGIVPGASDHAIVDENSFTAAGNILLTAPPAVNSVRWYCSQNAGINFNGKTLTVSGELTLASPSFTKTGNGKFLLGNSALGTVNLVENLTSRSNIEIESGEWQMHGNLFVDSLTLSGGTLSLAQSTLTLNHFIGMSASLLRVDNSTIQVEKDWRSDGSKLDIETSNAILKIVGNTTIHTQGISWSGVLENHGTLALSSTLTLDSLYLNPGSTLNISNGTTFTINQGFSLQGAANSLIAISSSGLATIQTNFHQKLCSDFVTVNNINLSGDAVVNFGVNSSIANASGWKQQSCDLVLFPEFNVRYNCENARTEFLNKSSGTITSYQWNFGDVDSAENESTDEHPIHHFTSEGEYTVTLTVFNGTQSQSYSKKIQIISNSLPAATIQSNSEVLFSSEEAPSYQWLMNDVLVPGETNRLYAYGGVEGFYQVLLYNQQCNRPSEVFTVSGLPTFQESWSIYPNPARERLYYSILDIDSIILRDTLGRSVKVNCNPSENWIDVSGLDSGLYILILKQGPGEWVKKVLVQK